jgi:hypothetical protein
MSLQGADKSFPLAFIDRSRSLRIRSFNRMKLLGGFLDLSGRASLHDLRMIAGRGLP